MKQLLDGGVGIREDETRHLVVFLAGLALEGNQGLDQLLLLVAPIGHVGGQLGASIPQQRHDEGYCGDQNADAEHFDEPPSLGVVDILHPPDGQMLVGGIEHRPDESTETSDHDEQRQFPDAEVGIVPGEGVELAEGEQFVHVGLAPPRVEVLDGEEGAEGDHGAEEGSPRQFGGPVGGTLLQAEEDATDGSPERGRDAGRGTARDEVALLAIVAEVAELGEGGVDAPEFGPALGDAGRDDGSGVDHGTLLPDGQTGRHRKRHTDDLADEGLDADDAGQIDAVEEALDLGDSGTAADRLEVDEEGGDGGEGRLVQEEGEVGGESVGDGAKGG